MAGERIAVIYSVGAVEWMSCIAIATNLAASYRVAFGKRARFFDCDDWRDPSDIRETARRIHRYDPDRIVFLDHTPVPDALLRALKPLYGRGLPPLIFHVYGDFMRRTREWIDSEELLLGNRALFVCASHRQVRLIGRLLQPRKGALAYIPFSIDARKYSASPRQRRLWRSRLGIQDGELVFTYAGRISLQKNNLRMLREFLRYIKCTGTKARFVVAGTFDDLGSPMFGITQKKGETRKKWRAFLGSLPQGDRRRIRFLGKLDTAGLRGLYNASDFYCSLSLYHDEEFGMAPAEALCCGTPCLLTDWAGFASFDLGRHSACVPVPVRLTRAGVRLRSSDVQKGLSGLARFKPSDREREARSRVYLRNFSVDAVARKLRSLHRTIPPVFPGFTPLMRRHAVRLNEPPLFPGGPRDRGFYKEIYRVFYR